MKKQHNKNPFTLCRLIIPSLLVWPTLALAGTDNTPWDSILNKIADSLTNSTVYAISIIAIVVCGIIMAFADLQGGAKLFVQAACGLSIAFFAMQITTQFFGITGSVI